MAVEANDLEKKRKKGVSPQRRRQRRGDGGGFGQGLVIEERFLALLGMTVDLHREKR
jgi:hypothetical protein